MSLPPPAVTLETALGRLIHLTARGGHPTCTRHRRSCCGKDCVVTRCVSIIRVREHVCGARRPRTTVLPSLATPF